MNLRKEGRQDLPSFCVSKAIRSTKRERNTSGVSWKKTGQGNG